MPDEGIWSAVVKRPLDVNSLGVAGIDGVDDEDMPMIRALCKVWRGRYPYNLIRSSYYFARYRFKDFGISIHDPRREERRSVHRRDRADTRQGSQDKDRNQPHSQDHRQDLHQELDMAVSENIM
ncbi:hypothetical protein [Bifidobacterium longum]|uniref:hypothetical protein n=1 Tax=Bifidobacterium longum TaxID=216816 RepID=UPI00351CD0F5